MQDESGSKDFGALLIVVPFGVLLAVIVAFATAYKPAVTARSQSPRCAAVQVVDFSSGHSE